MEKQELIIYKSADGKASVALYARDGDVWLSQNQMAELFATSKQNISAHIITILGEKELAENSVVKDFLTTATDGKNYSVRYYALPMILALGFRVRSIRGTQFRQWANRHLHEYMVKGFVMDDERLKNLEGRPDYFDEMLAQIRDIRASEKRFYQKVRDLFFLCSDYDPSDKATQMFFAETQNKLLFAVSGRTAAERLRANGITHDFEAAGALDPDHDGYTTAQEYIANTCPTNTADYFHLSIEATHPAFYAVEEGMPGKRVQGTRLHEEIFCGMQKENGCKSEVLL